VGCGPRGTAVPLGAPEGVGAGAAAAQGDETTTRPRIFEGFWGSAHRLWGQQENGLVGFVGQLGSTLEEKTRDIFETVYVQW